MSYTDDDIVNYVLAQHYGYWDIDENGERLDYNTNQTPIQQQAAQVSADVAYYETWKLHLKDALYTVKNWRAE